MTIGEFDPRDGGRYRYSHHDPEGDTYTFHGVFHDEPTLSGAVQTFEYEGAPGHVSLETLSLEERDGSTYVTTNSVFVGRGPRRHDPGRNGDGRQRRHGAARGVAGEAEEAERRGGARAA